MPNITIRTPKTDELSKIVDLAWRCHDHIKDELLDDTQVFAQKLNDGLVQSRVAVDAASGVIVGHACLKYLQTDDNVPELGVVFVDPAYQGHGIAKRLCQNLYDLARTNGADGVFDCSVTTHPFTQRAIQTGTNARPCSILFKIAARDLRAKGIEITPQEKGSVVNHYNAFTRTPATIHCPEHHAEMVHEIYGWHDLTRTFAKPSEVPATGPSAVFAVPLPAELDATFIIAAQVGMDTVGELGKTIQTAQKSGLGAVFAFLPLDTPHCPALVQQAETFGLSFAGIMPHIHDGGDRIILQWLASPVDFDSIQIYGDQGRRLFDYVKAEIKQ